MQVQEVAGTISHPSRKESSMSEREDKLEQAMLDAELTEQVSGRNCSCPHIGQCVLNPDRKHVLDCDEYHRHVAPKCCSPKCWCYSTAELTEQRGGWESPEALHDVARAFDGKWKVLFRIPFTKLEIAVFWRHE
jgi:hypothetical protein